MRQTKWYQPRTIKEMMKSDRTKSSQANPQVTNTIF